MVETAWLYPACEVTQTSELHTSESLKMRLHVGHVPKWIFLFNGFPLFLAWPLVLKELFLESLSIPITCSLIVEFVICTHVTVQNLLPTRTPVLSEVL